ncbi:aliphatic sulfonate ABC transporter substrate-binding protein [Agromyces aerolatus]|uniref:aliphatic sulfonate ABC transporter substrate-binding protein n=1 Tax=Agromyces sp. LY-1074 TaxID=3074080 RepID=UPI00285C6B5C|nr:MULTISPECIES: aliphatic sulfonate ABC transporter substrate-binding protein [unclassified Agromyces]MDR5700907.1 aliphatic sulfonate ABC transporter substrate-binding protein [Agromyces sp. LY-1074]MDR5707432.1 aliphatic sulfonate ABC transporter substrate-binding protein [Agromyces sp. LY-1358]
MNRTRTVAVLAVGLLALAGCASNPAPAPTEGEAQEVATVRVGYIPGAHDIAQLFVAEENGYFADEGIEIEVTPFQTGISLAQALTGGSLDMGVMGAVVANFPAKGQGKVIVLNNQQVDLHQIWAAPGSGIERVEDLRGKTIATTSGTAADLVLQVALDNAGLTREDVEIVNLDMPAVTNTFVTGGVDAASIWAPFDQQVEENLPDATLVATAADLDSPISGGWVAGNDYYDANPDVIDGLVRAWQKANDDLVADPEGSLEIFCPRIEANMDAEQCAALYAKTDAYSNDEWATYYEDGTAIGWLTNMQDVFAKIGALEGASLTPEDYLDTTTFVEVLAE